MAIELYTGFVGSGKSYAATRLGCQIADAKLGNGWVIANFPITKKEKMFNKFRKNKKYNNPRWIYKKNEELTPQFLIDMSIKKGWTEKESMCMLIFDEASIPFNSRNYNDKDRMKWIEFFTHSRKYGYDIILITQHRRMLDRQIRDLVEYEVTHRKLNNMLGFGWLNLFKLSIFLGVRYWNGLNDRSTKGQLRMSVYRKKIANRYDTMRLFD